MKFSLYISFVYLSIAVTMVKPMKNFFVNENTFYCVMMNLDANITAQYETTNGTKEANLNFENTTSEQTGICPQDKKNKVSSLRISMNGDQKLLFFFQNIDNQVVLDNITFTYNLPSSYFPSAINNGTITSIYKANMTLSSTSQYFQCFSGLNFKLSDGVTIFIHQIQLKVFNVQNNSLGTDKALCSGDLVSSTSPQSSILTSSVESTSRLTTYSTSPITLTPQVNISTTFVPQTSSIISSSITSVPQSSSVSSTNPATSIIPSSITSVPQSSSVSPTNIITSIIPSSITSMPQSSTTHTQSSIIPRTTTNTEKSTITSISSTSKSSSSTFKSSTVTNHPITTTVSPDGPKFAIRNNETVCLLIQTVMELLVTYEKTDKTSQVVPFKISSTTKYDGHCGKNADEITFIYSEDVFLKLSFKFTKETSSLDSMNITVNLTESLFPKALNPNKILSQDTTFGKRFEGPRLSAYTCSLSETLGSVPLVVNVNKLTFEVGRESNSTTFSGHKTDCAAKSPTVAIIVGVVVGVFLIIVVGLFIYFRLRARRRQGYQEI